MTSHDISEYKRIVGQYASGITVVAGMVDGRPAGFTCQAFHSISVNPRLISISIMRSSTSWPLIRSGGQFSINVLTRAQQSLSERFARSGEDKWRDLEWMSTDAGSPVLRDVLFWLDCRLTAEHDAGDHTIAIGEVVETSPLSASPHEPLIYFRGRYCEISSEQWLAGPKPVERPQEGPFKV